MFRETVNHSHGTTEGTASEAHALHTLRRAIRRSRYDIEATRHGGALITWTALHQRGETITEHPRSIEFAPTTPVGTLTETLLDDLARIDGDAHARYEMAGDRPALCGLLWRIPPITTARYRARGLVVEEAGHVRLSLTASLALLAHAHRTRTIAPQGYYRPDPYSSAGLNRPGRRAGLLHDGTSAALCSCGALAAIGDDRLAAGRLARDHRRAAAREFFERELAPSA